MPLRVGCVGAGYFSGFHRASWARMPLVRMVGCADILLAAAQATGLPAFDSADDLIARTRPDILDIAVPPEGHAAVVDAAIAGRVGHVICQKPFCTGLAQAEDTVARAEAAGICLVIHENFRFMPWYRTIRRALDDGLVGTLHQATFRLRPGDGQGPRAYLDRQPYFRDMPRLLIHETGVHWIDTFRYLMGEPLAVYADLRRINPAISGEDAGVVLFDHPGGVRAIFDGNRHLDHAASNLRRTMGEALFEGAEGTLTLAGDGSVRHRPFGGLETREILGPDTWDGFGGDCVHALQSHVVSAVTSGTPLENTARDYLRVLRVRDAIYASARTGRKVVL